MPPNQQSTSFRSLPESPFREYNSVLEIGEKQFLNLANLAKASAARKRFE